jgi:hypothetical protein
LPDLTIKTISGKQSRRENFSVITKRDSSFPIPHSSLTHEEGRENQCENGNDDDDSSERDVKY